MAREVVIGIYLKKYLGSRISFWKICKAGLSYLYQFVTKQNILINLFIVCFMKLEYVINMRLFFMVLIFAIGFSGYSAAAHAYGSDSCNPNVKIETSSMDRQITPDCSDHENNNQQKDSNQNHSMDKSASHSCCASHCCVIKAMDGADYKISYHPMKERPIIVFKGVSSSDFLFGIFRPPRLTV